MLSLQPTAGLTIFREFDGPRPGIEYEFELEDKYD
jgi:hypothetical protein